MVPINFNQLYYFWVTARANSITAAAKSLLLSPSTVSQQLKQLETALGKRLLSRTRHGVSLTDEGRLTLDYCERLYPQADELIALLRSDAALRLPIVRIGVSRSVSHEKILSATRFIRQKAGHAAVKVVSGNSADLPAMLERSAVDVVLTDMNPSSAMGGGFRAKLAASIPHFFVASQQSGTKGKPFPASLGDVPLMLRSSENPIRQEVDYFLRRNGISADIIAEVENPDLILTMVLQGEGIGVLDPHMFSGYEERGLVVRLHPRPIGIRENLWLVCRRQSPRGAAVQAILHALLTDFRFSYKGPRRTPPRPPPGYASAQAGPDSGPEKAAA